MVKDNHPEIIQHCARCGSRQIHIKDERAFQCNDCGFVFYFNTATAVGALVFNERGQLLLLRRAREPQKGMLDVPGGFVDFRENAEGALSREIMEELRVEAHNFSYHSSFPNTYLYHGLLYHTLDLFFTCALSPLKPPQPNDEVMEMLWVAPNEVVSSGIAFDSTRNAIAKVAGNR